MIPLPKPRGFWDYSLFALIVTGGLVFLFWIGTSDGVGWADAALAFTTAVLIVLAVILARKGEKAAWITRPTLLVHLLVILASFGVMFGAVYADAYLLHRRDITSSRLVRDIVLAVGLTLVMLWKRRRRRPVSTPN